MPGGTALRMNGSYTVVDTCSVIHAEGAEVLADFGSEYFAGSPALTGNGYGKGRAYFVAVRTNGAFLAEHCGRLVADLGISPAIDRDLPAGESCAAIQTSLIRVCVRCR